MSKLTTFWYISKFCKNNITRIVYNSFTALQLC